jgi:hypothetical protein
MTAAKHSDNKGNELADWLHQPASLVVWWILPILTGVSTSFVSVSLPAASFIWAGAFVWTGTGCLLNARRCSRLHCFISGPVLYLGAAAAGLVGLGVISGAHALDNVVWATAALAMLSCLPEMFWGKYARKG